MNELQNILDLNQAQLHKFFANLGEKPFRTKQIMQWIYKYHEFDFNNMLNLSKALREKLKTNACIKLPLIAKQNLSLDGTVKWAIDLGEKNHIEMVYIPEKNRGTLCISSQIGCALACSFCSTGFQGFNRNLSTAEIISQVLLAQKYLKTRDKRVSNVVFMGMGEPLLNETSVYQACDLLMDDLAFGLSRRRVTISSSGVVPAIKRMSERTNVSLAISLHAPNDTLRSQLVPVNNKYSIQILLEACKIYLNAGTQERHILFEYVMLKGINDSNNDAQSLAKLLKNISCKVNLIPFNPFPEANYQSSSVKTIENFQTILHNAGIRTMTRRTRGEDVDAACGQLAGKVLDKTKRNI
jgi:23S rRNA (adenine2503-C2)-methyltransferase